MNRQKASTEWIADISQSVAEYDAWYASNAPVIFTTARARSESYAERLLGLTDDLRRIDSDLFRQWPKAVMPLRLGAAPPMARDRLVTMARLSRPVVEAMERRNQLPTSEGAMTTTGRIGPFLAPLLDPVIFPWVADRRQPTAAERDAARFVLGDRIAQSMADPEIRNAQERRQKLLLRGYLADRGYVESPDPQVELAARTFAMGRTLRVATEDGQPQNLPIDTVLRSQVRGPLICLEMKSAGDFVNPNKRRKEESDKKAALTRTYGDSAILLLQLFGYFDRTYLQYEGGAGIDWTWDHRIRDLDEHLS